MLINNETKQLAIDKGYKKCTCSLGGYPSCICDTTLATPIYQHELAKWLRDKEYHIEVMLEDDKPYSSFYYRIMKIGYYFTQSRHGLVSLIYEEVLEAALVEALSFI